jgi:MFS transporter, DHA2 family, methylenomycin A resistance protein
MASCPHLLGAVGRSSPPRSRSGPELGIGGRTDLAPVSSPTPDQIPAAASRVRAYRRLNTGRQVGGAVGIALLGALVGGRPFATGMHLAMSAAAAAFAAGAALSWTTVG